MDTYGKPRFPYVWEEIKKLIDGKSAVSIETVTTSGTKIADITIDGQDIPIYAPDSPAGTTDYNELLNKPALEGVTLSGDKYLNEDGIHEFLTNAEIEALFAQLQGD